MTSLKILTAGPGVTLQDHGRDGYLRYGVTAAGAMDRLAHAAANLALDNEAGAVAIEISLGGIEVAAEGGALSLAVAGGGFEVLLDGVKLPGWVRLELAPGSKLTIRAGVGGAWTYLAVAGQIDLPPFLNSLSTHTRSALGGLEGRGLAAGDILPIAGAKAQAGAPERLLTPWLQRPTDVIRAVLGPQDDYFSEDQIEVFRQGPWTVSPRSDRMAFRLDGPRLTHARGFHIISDGIAMGSIQVPGDGQPLALMADRQSTGGYPKIATIIAPDVGRLAQLRPNQAFRFKTVSVDDAVAARRADAEALAAPMETEPVIRREFPSEFLLSVNLIGGATAG
ncbi:MAG: biotin-dependent carboxyltransferase family protein [Alphaproteobacteria bacterium]|nr:biotin-dependent carboxyltransferase family protein [Alphaproteobacteria bacterium]